MRDERRRARGRGRVRAVRGAALLAAAVAGSPAAGEQITSRWKEAVTGNWTDGLRWTSDPSYPQNGSPAGSTYEALIDAPGDWYWIRVDRDVVVDRVVVDSPNAFVYQNGTFRATNGIELKQGRWYLDGAIADTAITGAGSMHIGMQEYNGGLLRNVTLGVRFEVGWDTWATGLVLQGGHVNVTSYMASGAIGGTGRIVINNPGAMLEAHVEPMLLAPGIVVSNGENGGMLHGGTLGVVNRGLIHSDTPGARLSLAGKITNEGNMRADNGGGLLVDLRDDFTNNGVIELASGGRLELLGYGITESEVGNVRGNGGTVLIRGTMDLTGRTFPLDAFGGGWSVGNPGMLKDISSKITGGTIVSAGSVRELPVLGGVTFDGVAVDSDVRVAPGADVVVRNGTTFRGAVSLEGDAGLSVDSGQTLSGPARVAFDDASAERKPNFVRGANLTIGAGASIRTGTGDGVVGSTADALTNHGLISASDGSYVRVVGNGLANHGTLEAIDGGRLVVETDGASANAGTIRALSGGTLELVRKGGTWTNSGTIHVADSTLVLGGAFTTEARPTFTRENATVRLEAAVDNAGAVLGADAFGGSWTLAAKAKVTGGQLGAPGEAGNILVTGGSLSGVTVNADLDVQPGARLALDGASVNKGTLVARGGSSVWIGGASVNGGQVVADHATVRVTGSPGSVGRMTLADSTLVLGTVDDAQFPPPTRLLGSDVASVTRTRSTVVLGRGLILDNAGHTITVEPERQWLFHGARIEGGAISAAPGTELRAAGETTEFRNVRVTGPLAAEGTFSFETGSSWEGDRITFRDGPGGVANGRVVFARGMWREDPLDIVFDASSGSGSVSARTGGFTLASDVTVRRESGDAHLLGIGNTGVPFRNEGELTIDGVRVVLAGSTITNDGLIDVRDGGSLYILNNVSPTNFSARTLTGGRWHVSGGGTLYLCTFLDAVRTNAAEIRLSGATSRIENNSLRSLSRNEGTLSVLDGYILNVDALTNVGQLEVGRGSVLTTNGMIDSAAGTLDNDGLVVVSVTSETRSAVLKSITEQIRAARNAPEGRWKGKGITSSAAAANPLTGLAAVVNDNGSGSAVVAGPYGTVTPDANAIIIKHTYNGDANIDGRVNADDYFRIDQGFLAQSGDPTYRDGDFNYDGRVNADDYFLIDQAFLGQGQPLDDGRTVLAAVSVPEPAAVGLVLGAGLLMRRRRRG